MPSITERARALIGCPYALSVVLASNRIRECAEVRWVVWAYLRSALGWTLPRIARAFKRTHPSIIEGIAKAKANRELAWFVGAMAA